MEEEDDAIGAQLASQHHLMRRKEYFTYLVDLVSWHRREDDAGRVLHVRRGVDASKRRAHAQHQRGELLHACTVLPRPSPTG